MGIRISWVILLLRFCTELGHFRKFLKNASNKYHVEDCSHGLRCQEAHGVAYQINGDLVLEHSSSFDEPCWTQLCHSCVRSKPALRLRFLHDTRALHTKRPGGLSYGEAVTYCDIASAPLSCVLYDHGISGVQYGTCFKHVSNRGPLRD